MSVQLNPQQRAAVTDCDNHLLVLAGAGSGKTGVITRKIAWLVQQHEVAPEQIFAVTFTNKAAAEMRERVASLLDSAVAKKLQVSTFHRLGLQLLHREGTHLGLQRGFTLFDQNDTRAALSELIRERQLAVEDRQAAARIGDWKSTLVSPAQAMQEVEDALDVHYATLYAEYTDFLRACNTVDFDDLIYLPATLLRDNSECRERWQQRIRYLLVDEYQDTNDSQYALVKLLLGEHGRLTAVGDDDQSIYSWRGANPQNLLSLPQDFAGLRVIKLEQNYRSSQRILRCANAVIAENPHVFEKRLWSDLGIGDSLSLVSCRDTIDEADWVSADILTRQFQHNTRFENVAILYRSNFQSRALEQALRNRQIPYAISGGKSLFDRAEVRDFFAYLKILINPADDTSFLRVVNTPRRKLGASTLARLGKFASSRGVPLSTACTHNDLESEIGAAMAAKLREFGSWLQTMSRRADGEEAAAIAEQVLTDIDYQQWLQDQSASPEAAERAWENVGELTEWIARLATDEDAAQLDQREAALAGDGVDAGQRSLADIVSHIGLVDLLSRQEDKNNDSGQVQLMTLHAAKGLEFPEVYIIGFEEGVLPHHNSDEDDAIEEERRLAYVGMTRAKHRLTMTWSRTRSRFGETFSNQPSRFVDAIPELDLQRLGETRTAASVEANEATGSATLAGLKALLADSGN